MEDMAPLTVGVEEEFLLVDVDAVTGAVAPGRKLVDRLVRHVEPALDRHGDLATVHDLLDLLRRRGTGAARQRKARADGGLHEVLALLAKQTAGD
jgi:glutamate---cysteine ligase / carboxylate-amine ligase